MEKHTFKVKEEDSGQRLDLYLTKALYSKYSRSFIKRLISQGQITLNGSSAKAHHKVRLDDVLRVDIPEPPSWRLLPEDIHLEIVFEDEEVLVVNKPAGMVVHPAGGNLTGTLVNALLYHCPRLSTVSGPLKPGIVHRLDKDTSGLLVIAKSNPAHYRLAEQFAAGTVKRKYIALVKGIVQANEGFIDLPIGRHPRDRKRMSVTYIKSRKARTLYTVLKRFGDFTMLELTPKTGRTHQLRVHLFFIGHPILGDARYGTKGKIARQALHAKHLGFTHPVSGKFMDFSIELPDDMKELVGT